MKTQKLGEMCLSREHRPYGGTDVGVHGTKSVFTAMSYCQRGAGRTPAFD